MSKRNKVFIKIVIVILSIPFLLTGFSMSLPIVFGQTGQQAAPTTVQGPDPSLGNLEFEEQKAIIVVESPEGFTAKNSQMGTGNELTNMIIAAAGSSGVMGILNAFYTKITGKKNEEKTEEVKQDVRETNAGVLETKVAQTDLAKFTFDANKEKAEALNGTMPNIKIQKLEDNATEFAEKAAKT